MKDRDVENFLQFLFNVKTFWPLDIFKVDPSKSGLKQLDSPNELIRILGIQFDIKNVHIGKAFEQDTFPFHHRFTRQGPDVSQA